MQAARTVSQDYWRAQQAFQALEHVSLTDPLTQVPNRLHFERQYQLEWLRACRLNTRVGVMIVDLDHFKHINDEHGHPAGDLVLQAAAEAMTAAIMRPCDLLARYGGEEFIVLLPDITEDGAQVVAERLRTQVERLRIDLPSRSIGITCSVGYTCVIPGHELNADDLIRQADQALYQAKLAGRNRSQGWARPSNATEIAPQPAEVDQALP
ncbi:MAG: GGDEF domain-containing protein [Aquabacterium sp.]|nr:GGDEF domain-containing protein [Aquabacterium sp.]